MRKQSLILDPYAASGGISPGDNSSVQLLTTRYLRHSKSVAILWGVFTLCAAILNIVVFLQEEWVGHTETSKSPGHFGLWRFCTILAESGSSGSSTEASTIIGGPGTEPEAVRCVGRLDNFASILSPAFRASTVFVGLAVIVSLLCLVSFLLFCFMKNQSVFEICGTMQFLSGICLGIGILCFPAGWDNAHVRGICGAGAGDYKLGDCGIRWGYVLAVIAFFDAWILGCLALTLSHRETKPPSHMEHGYPGSMYKGEINGGFISDNQSIAGSRKSMNYPPVVMMPHPGSTLGGLPPPPPPPMSPPIDAYSEFSHRGRGQMPSPHRNPYATSIQNFQL